MFGILRKYNGVLCMFALGRLRSIPLTVLL